MKRLILALAILGSGTVAGFVLKNESVRAAQRLVDARQALKNESLALQQSQSEHDQLVARVGELKQKISAIQLTYSAKQHPLMLTEANETNWNDLSSEVYNSFLAELGLSWSLSDQYVIVSKKTLTEILFSESIKKGTLNNAVCGVLAMSPEEEARVNASLQSALAAQAMWVETHAQRIEPSGDIVAHYVIPQSPELSLSSSNAISTAANECLGNQRAQLFLDYIRSDLSERGVVLHSFFDKGQKPDVLIVRREKGNNPTRLTWELQRSTGGSLMTSVSPWQFPEPFRPLFPNGWPDIAAREGFELPKEFKKKAN